MRRRTMLASTVPVFLAGCSDSLPVSSDGSDEPEDSGGSDVGGEISSEDVSVGEARIKSGPGGDRYVAIPLSADRYAGLVFLELRLQSDDPVTITLPVTFIPPDRPMELRRSVEPDVTGARVESVDGPRFNLPPVDPLVVREVAFDRETDTDGSLLEPAVFADIDNTGNESVEFDPVVAILDGETIISVTGPTGEDTVAVAAEDSIEYEKRFDEAPPGWFDDAAVYPVVAEWEAPDYSGG